MISLIKFNYLDLYKNLYLANIYIWQKKIFRKQTSINIASKTLFVSFNNDDKSRPPCSDVEPVIIFETLSKISRFFWLQINAF